MVLGRRERREEKGRCKKEGWGKALGEGGGGVGWLSVRKGRGEGEGFVHLQLITGHPVVNSPAQIGCQLNIVDGWSKSAFNVAQMRKLLMEDTK